MIAPAIMVEVDVWSEDGEVLVSKVVRFVRTSDSMRRKGRYLLPELEDGTWLEMPFCLGPLSLRRLTGSERLSSLLSTPLSACRFECDVWTGIC